MSLPDGTPAAAPARPRGTPVAGVLAVLALVVAGVAGFYSGERHARRPTVLTGRAYVGVDQASVRIGDSAYGVSFGGGSLSWYDRAGTHHDGGTPPCLRRAGTYAWITFGVSPAFGPDGESWSQVTWVRCAAPH